MKKMESLQGGETCPKTAAINSNIFLIGFMGSGKSTISACFKKNYGMDVVEMDDWIARREGMSINEIFRVRGESYFRDAETGLLRELQDRTNTVISCGGGTPLREVNVAEMKKSGKVFLLTASPRTIYDRVKGSRDRPLLEGHKNVEYIAEMLESRRDRYEAAADVIIETDHKNASEICAEIMKYLQ